MVRLRQKTCRVAVALAGLPRAAVPAVPAADAAGSSGDVVMTRQDRAAAMRSTVVARRLQKFGSIASLTPPLTGGPSVLEKVKVSDPVRADYLRRVEAFEAWRIAEHLPPPP